MGAVAVQLAKAFGARVTGVDSVKKMEMVRSLGADQVIDDSKVDFTRLAERFELILDVGSTHGASHDRPAVAQIGRVDPQ